MMPQKTLDRDAKARVARRMTEAELDHAAKDCDVCVLDGVDPAYYAAEAAVYRQEQRRRCVAVTPESRSPQEDDRDQA